MLPLFLEMELDEFLELSDQKYHTLMAFNFWSTGRILKLQKSKKLRILPAFEWNYLQSCTGKGKENRRQKIEQKVQWKLKKGIKIWKGLQDQSELLWSVLCFIKTLLQTCRQARNKSLKSKKKLKKLLKTGKGCWKATRKSKIT